ncbi:ribosome maturation factor RimM [Natronosporangium hydrolyticum]|uniref:Ribosome maturation factor RimM n=1 Tax=Natronosporangium hydrolyticum TaxID=2811111 RepID=A0A895YHM5_9ACTN|nr:ribosome maturation factor RimM [Natronosporangium hydrolyticum]QSB17424.1 ribosome maturation factor RimM [Natronosporangium hydrolyticum]
MLTIGRIVRPHGVRGEVVVEVATDEPTQRYAVGAVLGAKPPTDTVVAPATLRVAGARPHQGRLIVAFEGVADRDAAERLRGVLLRVESGELPAPVDPEEFLDHQLEGLAVVTVAGESVGTVLRVDHAPAADLLVVSRPAGGTALVPFVTAIVPEVDLDGGRLVVDPPAGLLEL